MSRSTAAASTSAGVVLGVLIFTAWRLWYTKKRGRRLSVRYLLDASDECNGKVLDLRQEDSFEKARVRGSHNIPVASLWGDNRWYELPEQHEPLIVLIPEDGAPDRGMTCDSLAKEIKSRRAEGATATLVFDESLLDAARETGLLLEGGGVAEESERPVSPSDGPGDRESPTPSRTLFTPSPFLTRAAPAIEPHLRHAWLPLTCIDIGCGAGRDAVWLARRGWKVTAMDCWDQVLQKAARLSRTYGVADRVEVVRGKVKNTGEIHLSVQPEGAKQDPAPSAVDGPDAPEDAGGLAGASESGEQVAAGAVPVGEQRIITPLTPASGYGAFTLVVAIRFLERSAFDTLARLVDPRGGYILLSTFIEEERETMAGKLGSDGGRGGGTSRKKEKEDLLRASALTAAANAAVAAAAAATAAAAAAAGAAIAATHRGIETTYGRPRKERSCSKEGGDAAAADRTTHRERSRSSASDGQSDIASAAPSATQKKEEEGDEEDEVAKGSKAKKKKKNKPGSAAAALAAAAAAATLARWPHTSPRDPKKILRRGELARHFGDRHGFEVLEDSVVRLPDGRPVCCFLARRLPLVVSSPSNASNASSVASSPWRDSAQTPQRQQRLQPQGSPLATPASSFGPVPDAALFLQKSPLEPTPEAPAPGTGNTSADSTAPDGKSSSPANGFPLHSSTFSEDSSSGHDGDGDVFGGAAGDVRSGGRAAMWGGVSGATSGSVRDFTASRAASSSRRLAERRQSGLGFAHYGGGT